jgi:hypothetical protein
MLEIILFVVSFTTTFLFSLGCVVSPLGKNFVVPIPLLHYFDIDFTNAYMLTPSIMYQVYFWFERYGLFVS